MLGVTLPDPENVLDGVQLRAVRGVEYDTVPGSVDDSTHVVVDSAVVHQEHTRATSHVVLRDEVSEVRIECLGRVGHGGQVAVTDTVCVDRGDGVRAMPPLDFVTKHRSPRFAHP